MHTRYAKWEILIVLIMVVSAALSGCSAPKDTPTDDNGVVDTKSVISEITLTNDPTPTPTHVPETTFTPRPVTIPVDTLAPNATAISIVPIDKPTKTFKFTKYESQALGLTFNVPDNWVEMRIPQSEGSVMFSEPDAEALDGYSANLRITVTNKSTNLTREDAKPEIDAAAAELKAEFPAIELSSLGDNNKMLGEYGYYYNFRVQLPSGYYMRGRVFTLAINRMLIKVEMRNPALYNEDYLVAFREIRNSAKTYSETQQ